MIASIYLVKFIEIQDLLTEDEISKDCWIYDDLFEEINAFCKAVYKWMFDTDQRVGWLVGWLVGGLVG